MPNPDLESVDNGFSCIRKVLSDSSIFFHVKQNEPKEKARASLLPARR
jgi:hypothetical protein